MKWHFGIEPLQQMKYQKYIILEQVNFIMIGIW